LFYDWYRRTSLVDHFLKPETTLEAFATSRYHEQGDFVNQPYAASAEDRQRPPQITLSRRGAVWVGETHWPIEVRKSLRFDPIVPTLIIDYAIKNLQSSPVTLHFGIEFVFALLAGHEENRCYIFPGHEVPESHLGSAGTVEGAESVELLDAWLQLHIALACPGASSIWRFPIETVSQSESGYERVYQSSVVFPNWRLQLAGRGRWTNQLVLTINKKI
jgi:alpha-amylase